MILKVSTRIETGTMSSKQARRKGKLPATVYGKDFEPISVLVDDVEARGALRKLGRNAVLDLDIDGQKKQKAMIQYVSYDAITQNILNIEFRVIRAGDRVRVSLPIVITGGDSIVDGDVLHTLLELAVEVPADNIPAEITHDVTGMQVGDVLTVADLIIPSDVTLMVEEDEPVVSVAAQQVFEEPETDEDADEADVLTVDEEDASEE